MKELYGQNKARKEPCGQNKDRKELYGQNKARKEPCGQKQKLGKKHVIKIKARKD